MSISKYLWNKIKKEADADLESLKQSAEYLKATIQSETAKFERIKISKMTELYRRFETPNQYLLFLATEHSDVLTSIENKLRNGYRYHPASKAAENFHYCFTTITHFTNFNNIWEVDISDECLYYPIAIGFDKKITGEVSITWDAYNDIYKFHFQNDSWIPLLPLFRQLPKKYSKQVICDYIRISCSAKPVLYVMSIIPE